MAHRPVPRVTCHIGIGPGAGGFRRSNPTPATAGRARPGPQERVRDLDTYTRTILNANRLGIPVVIAVGNEGSQTSGSLGNDLFAFTVGATDADDRPAGFSGGRSQIINVSRYIDPKFLPLVFSKPEVTAPGVDVFSSIPGGKWDIFSGTSMATPHVAGAVALLLSKPTEPKATKRPWLIRCFGGTA